MEHRARRIFLQQTNGFRFCNRCGVQRQCGAAHSGTNSSFLPQWWYAGTAICDVTCTEYGVQATATDAVRAEDLECRSLPVWFRVDVPAEGVYRTKITVTGTDGGEVLVFIGRRRLVWRGTLAAGENKTITAYCDVFPIVPRGQVDAVPSTAVNVTVVGGALAAASGGRSPGCPPHLGVR